MDRSKIQWCDSTHNFWRGCKPVSAGCANCYAKKQVERFGGDFAQRIPSQQFNLPMRWNKKPWVCDDCGKARSLPDDHPVASCDGCGEVTQTFHRRRVFSLSLGDWLDPEVPGEWLADMLDVVRRCDQLEWILCTKRPKLFEKRLDKSYLAANKSASWELSVWLQKWAMGSEMPNNVTILASVEDQQTADERIPPLLKIPAARRGLSIEPLLGPVDLYSPRYEKAPGDKSGAVSHWKPSVDWVIVGGESGQKARPCEAAWIGALIQQCKEVGVPCFVKQLGSNSRVPSWNNKIKHPKGGDPAEWPEELRVREFPNQNH